MRQKRPSFSSNRSEQKIMTGSTVNEAHSVPVQTTEGTGLEKAEYLDIFRGGNVLVIGPQYGRKLWHGLNQAHISVNKKPPWRIYHKGFPVGYFSFVRGRYMATLRRMPEGIIVSSVWRSKTKPYGSASRATSSRLMVCQVYSA